MKRETCIACGETAAEVFFDLDRAPVLCNAPCASREEALHFPAGRIALAFCAHCGHVFNAAFDPGLLSYNQQYENSLHYSPCFDTYIRNLAAGLVERFGLRGKDIVEIGCGKGDFLALLCELGDNRGLGFDPSYEPGRVGPAAAGRLRIVRDLYGEAYAHLPCDFLCSRHTLEHLPAPAEFLKMIRRAAGERSPAVFFEVPNALYTLRQKGIWDIIYEHVSYFWSLPLSKLFTRCGFTVRAVRATYGEQFLCLEASSDSATDGHCWGGKELERVAADAASFGETFRSVTREAAALLENLEADRRRAVVWGAGSKGVMFLNLFKESPVLDCAVDINPNKQGKYIPGSGHRIVADDALRDSRPDVVLVMNPLYEGEIAKRLAELGVRAELVTV